LQSAGGVGRIAAFGQSLEDAMSDKPMLALTYSPETDPWEKTRGMRKTEQERPELRMDRDYHDGEYALVKVKYAGFCGSDRGIWFRYAFGDMIQDSLRREGKRVRIIGHEMLGEIVEIGPEAQRRFGYRPGDLVSTESHIVCDVCYQCRVGDNHVCSENKILGISTDGCFAQYIKLPAKSLWPTDISRIRPEVAAIQEPFGNAVHACTKVPLRGQRVAIIGCGTIGLTAILVARALGARYIIGVEPNEEHQMLAKALGADEVLAPTNVGSDRPHAYTHDSELARRIRELTDGVGVDVALEMSGSNASVNNAVAACRRGGHVILFGLKAGDAVIEDFDRLIVDGISLHSVIGRRIFETWHVTRHLLESRENSIQDLIYNVILKRGRNIVPFSEWEFDSFEKLISSNPKVLIRFD
jgi:threonine 3-dehydrogenase